MNFSNTNIDFEALKERAFNYRWATLPPDVIPLTAADPDFPVAEEIRKAIHDYSQVGHFSYGPSNGLPAFKEAIAHWHINRKNTACSAELVLPVNSAAQALFLVAQYILSQGDEAIIPNPVDFLFRKSIENAGGVAIPCSLNMFTGSFDLEQLESLITPKTKAIFICNPNNPLGKVMTLKDLNAIGQLAQKHNLWIVSDEIWSDIVYKETTFYSVASLHEDFAKKTFIISGLSKNFGLAGLRVGYVIMPDLKTYEDIFKLSKHGSTAYGISTLSQIAGTAALTHCESWLDGFLSHLSDMRSLVLQHTQNSKLFEVPLPNSTYVAFPKLQAPYKDSPRIVKILQEKAKVALIPGTADFFESQAEGHIRICYATSKEVINEAFERIDAYIEKGGAISLLPPVSSGSTSSNKDITQQKTNIENNSDNSTSMIHTNSQEEQSNYNYSSDTDTNTQHNYNNQATASYTETATQQTVHHEEPPIPFDTDYEEENSMKKLFWIVPLALLPFILLFGFIFLKNRTTSTNVENNKVVTASTEVASTTDTEHSNNVASGYESQDSYTANEATAYESGDSYTETEDNTNTFTDYDDNAADSDTNTAYETESNTEIEDYAESNTGNYNNSNESTQNNSLIAEASTQHGGLAVRNAIDIPSGYYAIVNAFSNKRNALKYAKRLNDQSYDAYVVQNNHQYRTSIYLDTNESEARSMLSQIKRNVKNDAWLMKN